MERNKLKQDQVKGYMAQLADCLPSMHKVLGSIPKTIK